MKTVQWTCGPLLVALAMASTCALACGMALPRHGGITSDGEITFELVQRPKEVLFYVENHGGQVAMSGAKGTVTVQDTQGATVTYEATGQSPNLVTTSIKSLPKDAKVSVRMIHLNGDIHVARFSLDAKSLELWKASRAAFAEASPVPGQSPLSRGFARSPFAQPK